jgi:hypothetical protein
MMVREARQIFPVIRVPAGRKGTLVVLEGQSLEWKSYDGLYSVRREPMRQNQPETRR